MLPVNAAQAAKNMCSNSESARWEILSRLLRLNHERYEEAQKAEGGMQEEGRKSKVKGRKGKSKSTGDGQLGMF